MNWQRARTEERKGERKDAICEAAVELFKKNGYENVSFNGIAAEAGFTKSNLYRYFSSREEIFLNIFSDLLVKWIEDCHTRLQKLKPEADVDRFARSYVNSLKSHPEFLDLTPILFVSLERNSSFEQLLEFKKLAQEHLYRISTEISRIYPDLNDEKAFELLNLCHAATSNYWAASSQNAALKKIYRLKEFKILKPDFEQNLTSAIEVFIYGIRSKEKKNSKKHNQQKF